MRPITRKADEMNGKISVISTPSRGPLSIRHFTNSCKCHQFETIPKINIEAKICFLQIIRCQETATHCFKWGWGLTKPTRTSWNFDKILSDAPAEKLFLTFPDNKNVRFLSTVLLLSFTEISCVYADWKYLHASNNNSLRYWIRIF